MHKLTSPDASEKVSTNHREPEPIGLKDTLIAFKIFDDAIKLIMSDSLKFIRFVFTPMEFFEDVGWWYPVTFDCKCIERSHMSEIVIPGDIR